MSEIVAALFGAAAAGIIQTILEYIRRTEEREATLVAIASEAGSICQMLRAQEYLEDHKKLCEEIQTGKWDGKTWVIDIRSNYFSVFEALAPKLGSLKPEDASSVVRFYMMCKTAIDAVRPDGAGATDTDLENRAKGVFAVTRLLEQIYELGDQIVQFPKETIVFESLK